MKTRSDLYSQEAAELLRLITMYPGILELQLIRFFYAGSAFPISTPVTPSADFWSVMEWNLFFSFLPAQIPAPAVFFFWMAIMSTFII